jgi:nucleoid DNA-binding protein
MTFKKKDLIEILNNVLSEENLIISNKHTERILDKFLIHLEDAIIKNPNGVRLGQSGVFKIILRKERAGMNLRTQEPLTIPARHAVIFKPSIALKKRLKK